MSELTEVHLPMFDVVDVTTGRWPDVARIAIEEEWAQHLIHSDIDGFALTEYGRLVLIDDTGATAFCPPDRFRVELRTAAANRDAPAAGTSGVEPRATKEST